MSLDELLAAAEAHRDRCADRYGPDSYQVRAAERAVATIQGRIVSYSPG